MDSRIFVSESVRHFSLSPFTYNFSFIFFIVRTHFIFYIDVYVLFMIVKIKTNMTYKLLEKDFNVQDGLRTDKPPTSVVTPE